MIYDLIIGNDVYKHGVARYDVEQYKPERKEKVTDFIFENSKLGQSSVQLGSEHKVNNEQSVQSEYEHKEIRSTVTAGEKPTTEAEQLISTRSEVTKDINSQSGAVKAEVHSAAEHTRAQKQTETRAPKPLKVEKVEALDISCDEFKQMQKEDENLNKYWKLAAEQQSDDEAKAQFLVRDEVLCRVYKAGPHADPTEQVFMPEKLIDKVIELAHESLLSGHQGIARTTSRVMQEFYFPKLSERIKRFVRSCDLCQRCSNKKVGGQAPLQAMPIASNAFDTVYTDIVGEIIPSSAEGHRWILTMIDSATRFFIAVPMKKIDSVSVAEALMKQFSIFGIPRIIHHDQASNLSSEMLQQLWHLYGSKMQHSTIYHPQGNSVIEKSHSTMKNILKKMIVEQPKQWHRYIDPLLFATRSVPNSSGYSSFELMFGRRCRTHMSILKELWTGQNHEPEVKTTYQYVLDLRERIEETCKLAQDELIKEQGKNKKYFDKKAKLRVLEKSDKVLVLLPTVSNKLLFQWKGPAEVTERRGLVNYRVKFESGEEKTFHINMLKKYNDREASNDKTAIDVARSDVSADIEEASNDTEVDVIAAMGVVEDSDNEDECQERLETSNTAYYSTEQKETWKDVNVNPELSPEQSRQVWKLTEEFSEIFSDVPTTTHILKHDIKLTSDEPVYSKPYKLPYSLVEPVEKEITEMKRQGWIEPSDASYASPLVVVKKKKNSDDIRLCVNYKKLNDITVNDPMPMAEIDNILTKIGQTNMYSNNDMCKGYYAIQMTEESKDYTTFCTPTQNYRFLVMPFGLKTAGASYTRLLEKVLENAENLENFIDDVIAHSDRFEKQLETLRDLFVRVKQANLKIKPSKTRFCYPEVEFLGHVISRGNVKSMQTNVEKITNAPIPKTKKGIRSLIGAIGFLRKFIPDCSRILKPLTDLTGKNKSEKFVLQIEHQEAFDKV